MLQDLPACPPCQSILKFHQLILFDFFGSIVILYRPPHGELAACYAALLLVLVPSAIEAQMFFLPGSGTSWSEMVLV